MQQLHYGTGTDSPKAKWVIGTYHNLGDKGLIYTLICLHGIESPEHVVSPTECIDYQTASPLINLEIANTDVPYRLLLKLPIYTETVCNEREVLLEYK